MRKLSSLLLVAAGLLAGAPGHAQMATYDHTTIAPSIRASADTTGVTDSAALTAALAAHPVYLARGTYYVCNVTVPNGAVLEGVAGLGYADTYLTTPAQTKLVAGSACATQVLNVSAVANGAVLRNLYIDCNSRDIMGIGNASHRLNIDTVTVTNCSPAGVKGGLGSAAGYSFGTKIHHSNFYGNGYGAIDLIDGAVDDSNFTSNNNCGVYFTTGSGYTNFTATRFEWNTTYGACVYQGVGVQFAGGLFDRNTLGGLKLNGSNNVTVTGTIFVRNGKDNGTTLLEATQIAITGGATDSTFTGIQSVVGNETVWGSVGGSGTVTPKYVFSFDTGINAPDGVYVSNSLLTGYTSALVNPAGGAPTHYTVINSRGLADSLNAVLPVAQGGTGSASGVTLAAHATQATNTVVGNATSGTASPTALPVGTCSTSASALNWTTNTGFGCNTAVNAATLGGATFAAPGPIGSGTPSTGAFTTLSSTSNLTNAGYQTPQIIFSWGIPVIIPSSGTISANPSSAGGLTSFTALANVADCSATTGCYMYFPLHGITASSSAGLYFTRCASASSCSVFNNTLSSGVPTTQASPTSFGATGINTTYAQTTGAALTLLTLSIPGNLMGANGDLVFDIPWGRNNTAGTGTFLLNYGGTAIGTQTAASVAFEGFFHRTMRNAGTTGAQYVFPAAATSSTESGTSTSTESFPAVDSTQSQNMTITIQLGTATDTFKILGGKIIADYAP